MKHWRSTLGILLISGIAAMVQSPATTGNHSIQTTMEQNKVIVQRFNKEVIEEGSERTFKELMDPAFVNHSAPAGTDPGPEGMLYTILKVLRPAFSNLKVEILDQVAEGDKVVSRKRITGQHTGTLMGIAATQKTADILVIDIIRLKNGRYLEHWGMNNLSQVLTQLKGN